ncbi:MAG: hypothetical protein MJZ61_03890 [Bacteroidales bacterium]|nr:hypothetical protein [Bacteroidales bacterium]
MQVSDRFYIKRLNEFSINALTTYFSNGNKIVTDSSADRNPNVSEAIKLEKDYIRGGKSLLKLHKYDPRIKYTFMDATTASKCPNCGADVDPHSHCCPYCGSTYNMDYATKDLGTKYHTDLVMNSNTYKYITLLVDVIFSFIISYIYIKTTGRTFYAWDFGKVLVGTALLSLIFYYFFYYLDSVMVLLPIKIYKQRINDLQTKFWEDNGDKINKQTFFTNLNYELQKFYFERPENRAIVDFDFVDYTTIKLLDDKRVSIDLLLREIYYTDSKLKVRQVSKTVVMERAEREYHLEVGKVYLKCKNCGATVDPFAQECPHCGTRQNYLQEWYMGS